MSYKYEPVRELKIEQCMGCDGYQSDRWTWTMWIWNLDIKVVPNERETYSMKTYEQAHAHAMKMRQFFVDAYVNSGGKLLSTR